MTLLVQMADKGIYKLLFCSGCRVYNAFIKTAVGTLLGAWLLSKKNRTIKNGVVYNLPAIGQTVNAILKSLD